MSVQSQLRMITDDRERYETALRIITEKDYDEAGGAVGYALFVNLVANLALNPAEATS